MSLGSSELLVKVEDYPGNSPIPNEVEPNTFRSVEGNFRRLFRYLY